MEASRWETYVNGKLLDENLREWKLLDENLHEWHLLDEKPT